MFYFYCGGGTRTDVLYRGSRLAPKARESRPGRQDEKQREVTVLHASPAGTGGDMAGSSPAAWLRPLNGRDNAPGNGRAARPRPHRGLPAPWPSTACAAASEPALDSAPRPAPASHWLEAAAGPGSSSRLAEPAAAQRSGRRGPAGGGRAEP